MKRMQVQQDSQSILTHHAYYIISKGGFCQMFPDKKDSSNPGQILTITPNCLDIRLSLKTALARAVKNCHLSIHQIAAGIADLTGIELTGTAIYNYTATSHHNMPRIDILPAFCAVTKNYEVIDILVNAINKIENTEKTILQ